MNYCRAPGEVGASGGGLGRIQAHIRCFDLDDALVAYRTMGEGKLEGRAVIVPS